MFAPPPQNTYTYRFHDAYNTTPGRICQWAKIQVSIFLFGELAYFHSVNWQSAAAYNLAGSVPTCLLTTMYNNWYNTAIYSPHKRI